MPSRDELIATVTRRIERAGADVTPAGAVQLAGDGPAAAAPWATAG